MISEWSVLTTEREFDELRNANLLGKKSPQLLAQGFLNSCDAEKVHFERAAEKLLTKK